MSIEVSFLGKIAKLEKVRPGTVGVGNELFELRRADGEGSEISFLALVRVATALNRTQFWVDTVSSQGQGSINGVDHNGKHLVHIHDLRRGVQREELIA